MKRSVSLLAAISLLLMAMPATASAVTTRSAPQVACTTGSAGHLVPCGYGTVLVPGSSWFGGLGVDVMSNGSSAYDCLHPVAPYGPAAGGCSSVDSSILHRPLGDKWQSVELATRFYNANFTRGKFLNSAFLPASVTDGSQIWWGADANDFRKHPQGHLDATDVLPGDLIIFRSGFVSIVDHLAGNNVFVAEQDWGASNQTGQATFTLSAGTLTGHGTTSIFGVLHARLNNPQNLNQPSPPVMAVKLTDPTTAHLTWAPVPTATGYVVGMQYAPVNSPVSSIGSPGTFFYIDGPYFGTSFTAHNLPAGSNVSFFVNATNAAGISDQTLNVGITTAGSYGYPDPPPVIVSCGTSPICAQPTNGHQIDINWTESPGATYYQIRRFDSDSLGEFLVLHQGPATDPAFHFGGLLPLPTFDWHDSGLASGIDYRYAVCAGNAAGINCNWPTPIDQVAP